MLCCGNSACEDQSHRADLKLLLNDTVKALQSSSDHLATSDRHKFNKPGWSDYVSDLYDFSCETYRF